jgi:hypothetical protein
MLIDDCTSVPTWQACRDRDAAHISVLNDVFACFIVPLLAVGRF